MHETIYTIIKTNNKMHETTVFTTRSKYIANNKIRYISQNTRLRSLSIINGYTIKSVI